MGAIIKPAMVLEMDLDASVYSDEVAAEIKRSYAYVAAPLVTSSESGGENVLRASVKIRYPYWYSADEGADTLWEEVLVPWLGNLFEKLSVTMLAFNKNRAEKGDEPLLFDRLELQLKDANIDIILEADSTIPANAVELVEQTRNSATS